jgi:RNA-directed DNA polymerase
VFGDRTSGAYLPKFAWTKIVRHSLVRGDASPDDPAQAGYWAERRSKNRPLLDRSTLHLLRRKHGSCPICGELLHADREPQGPRDWEQWHRTTRKAITRQIIAVYGERPAGRDPTRSLRLPPPNHRRTAGTSSSALLKSPQWLA